MKTRPPGRQGSDVKKEIVNKAVPKTIVPKSMAVGQFFRIVQVVPAAPSFVLLPTALVRTVDTTQTLPETVRSIRLQDPDDTVDAKTVDRTQNSTDAGVDKTDNRTQQLTDAGVDKTDNITQQLTDAGVDKTDNITQQLTDAGVDKTDNITQKLTDAGVDKTNNITQKLTDAGVDKTDNRTQQLTDAGVDKTDNRTQKLTDAGVDKTDNKTQNSTETRLVGGARNSLLLKCSSIGLNVDQHPELMDYLPKDNEYHVCSYKHVSQPYSLDHTSFKATLRMTLKTKEDLQVWLKSMLDTWRVESVRPCKGKRTILKTVYRCQHNTRRQKTMPPPARASKNTSCTAKLVVTILPTVNTNGRLSRSTDPHIPVYPTVVEISRVHNHNISVAGVVGTAAVEKLTKLFESGHSPSSALDVLKYSPSSALDVLKLYKIFGKTRSTHRRRPASSLPKSQKNKKEQTDNLMQGQSSQQNPSQGDIGTNQEECEAASAADFLCLSDYEEGENNEDTEDLVESMIRDISSLRKDPMYSQAIAAMAKQFHHIKSNPSRLLSLFGKGQTSSRRTATRRPDTLSPCQPTVTPRPVTKLSSKMRLPSGPQQTHSNPIKRPRMIDLQ